MHEVIVVDGHSTDAAEIPRFVAALCHGADFVKGSRFAQGDAIADITLVRRWSNLAVNSLVNHLLSPTGSALELANAISKVAEARVRPTIQGAIPTSGGLSSPDGAEAQRGKRPLALEG